MGQPSFQASNAIIYLTYGAFLYVEPHMLSHNHTGFTNRRTLKIQSLRPLYCVVLEKSVEVGIFGDQSYTEGLDTIHVDFLPLALANGAQIPRLDVRKKWANH